MKIKEVKITVGIKLWHQNRKHRSSLEKPLKVFGRFLKLVLASKLRPGVKAEILRQTIIVLALLAQTAILIWILALFFDRL